MRERLDAKYLKKNLLRRREATKYIYSKIPEVIFSVDNSRKRIAGLDFLRGVSEKYPTCVYIFAPERSSGLYGVRA